MIGTKSSGSSSDKKDEPKSEQGQQTHKGKEIQRPKPIAADAEWHSWKRSPQPGCFVAVIA